MSEEQALEKYDASDIEVYHSYFTPLECTVPKRDENSGYAKLICVKSLNVSMVRFYSIHLVSFESVVKVDDDFV